VPGFFIPDRLSGVRPPQLPEVVSQADADLVTGLNGQLVALYGRCDGFLTDAGITIYEVDQLVERNATYEVAQYAPGYVLFGDDSGGRGFLLQAASAESPVFSTDLGDLDPDDFDIAGPSLSAWVSSLR